MFKEPSIHKSSSDDEALIAGLAVYIARYPDAVKDGFPEEGIHPNHFALSTAKTIRVCKEWGSRSGPSGHWRNAHPRFLEHPRFKHTRFKRIWVKGAFVNGDAKTVVEVEAQQRTRM